MNPKCHVEDRGERNDYKKLSERKRFGLGAWYRAPAK